VRNLRAQNTGVKHVWKGQIRGKDSRASCFGKCVGSGAQGANGALMGVGQADFWGWQTAAGAQHIRCRQHCLQNGFISAAAAEYILERGF